MLYQILMVYFIYKPQHMFRFFCGWICYTPVFILPGHTKSYKLPIYLTKTNLAEFVWLFSL